MVEEAREKRHPVFLLSPPAPSLSETKNTPKNRQLLVNQKKPDGKQLWQWPQQSAATSIRR